MTTTCLLRMTLLTAAVFSASGVSAYTDDKDKQLCKIPKFRDFNLPVFSADNKAEVAPESVLSFTISSWINPDSIAVTIRDVPLELDIVNKNTFYKVSTKLPASLNGKFARINARADALLGCKGVEGWLIKIADAQSVPTPEQNTETKVEQAPVKSAVNGETDKDVKVDDSLSE